jgi:chromosome segregation ATPase
MKYLKILAASQAQQIDPLIDGLPVNGNGYFFTEEMMDNVEAALTASNENAASAERIVELENQLTAANESRTTAEESLAAAQQTITANHAEIERLNAELNKAASDFENTVREKDEQGGAVENYATSEKNPINQFADSVLPKQRKK